MDWLKKEKEQEEIQKLIEQDPDFRQYRFLKWRKEK